jgi:hypothetical protein
MVRATRIDVLHSPFVFNLYNSCIKPTKRGNSYALFLAITSHLSIPIAKDISAYEANMALFIPQSKRFSEDEWIKTVLNIGDKGMFLVEYPYDTNRQSFIKVAWKMPHIHVCIDLFDASIIMRRDEQAKEFFKLRW